MPEAPLTPRKAPRQARAQATRDAILQAATQILSAQGLKGFNTNAVAARAGTSIGSLYQYFPNKDALMLALIHRQNLGMFKAVSMAMADVTDRDLQTSVRILVRAVMEHIRDDSLLAMAIDHEEARLPIADVIDGYMRQGSAMMMQLFNDCGSELEGLDYCRAARTLPVIIRAVIDEWSNGSPAHLDIAEDEAVCAILGYLARQKEAGPRRTPVREAIDLKRAAPEPGQAAGAARKKLQRRPGQHR